MKIYKVFQTLDAIYIFLLSIGVGCIICAGFSAATIFRAADFVPDLTRSDSGLIIGLIFIKCNYLFNFLAAVIIIYELTSSYFTRYFSHAKHRKIWLLLGGVNVILIFLFTLYYTPYIMEAQALNTIDTKAFDSMHKQSELVFKILLITLSASALWRGIIGTRPQHANAQPWC